ARTKKAVTAVAFSLSMENSDKKLAMDIANSFGSAFELEEKLFSAFIGISGSAIAYVFEMIHQIAMGGVREGIAYPKSLEIVRDTFESATSLLKESGLGAVELETMVCSAGGTTIEGVKALEDGNLGATLINAVSAAAEKSRKMEAKGR
ncbi:MAG: pyrroline-5-carboxylate reductase, partial [Spirochaetales bacterium]|nr:pyrroline-5-carboxylate reductase [Spirochaetales bacterium]